MIGQPGRHGRCAPDVVPYLGLAGLYLRADSLDEAARFFEKAIARDPGSAVPLSMLGVIELKRSNLPQAIDYLERARALDPRNVQVLYNLSVAYTFSQRFEEARAAAQALLRIQPNHAQGRALLARLRPESTPAGSSGP